MWSVVQYAYMLLRSPTSRAGMAVTLLVSIILTLPIARRLGWSTFGTGLSLFGLGGAISLTFVNRLGRKDLVWEPQAVAQPTPDVPETAAEPPAPPTPVVQPVHPPGPERT